MEVKEHDEKTAYKPGFWKKRKMNRSMYTGDDASALLSKDVDDKDQAYAYNVTDFKVSALISEATYNSSQTAAIRSEFNRLKKLLMKAGHVETNSLKVKVSAPKHDLQKKLIADAAFLPTESIELCGSFITGLSLASTMIVDVRLVIPKAFYRIKDYLNQKWLVKKSFYVAVLAHHLIDNNCYKVHYFCPHNNPLDIGLQVVCKDSVTFNIHLHTEEGLFPVKRLAPLASNVRAEHVGLSELPDDTEIHIPTPLYNNTLATNQIAGDGEQLTADWINESSVIKQCMILTKIWMHQRLLDTGFQSVSSFTVRMFMIYLVKNCKLPYHTTGHQMFHSFLQKLAVFDWSKPICMKETIEADVLANHKQVSEYVFLDPTGLVNYCAAVSKEAMEQLRHHAEETVVLMKKYGDGSFEDTFLKKLPPHLYYDYSIKLTSVSSWSCSERNRYIDSCGDVLYSALPKVLQVLRRGVGDRITHLVISPVHRMTASVNSFTRCSALFRNEVIIRLSVNLDTAFNNLERGPPADDPLADEFRLFWGELSNLRRFMDGAICEAVVWNAERLSVKRRILAYIVKCVLLRHCKIEEKTVIHGIWKFEDYLSMDNFDSKRNWGTGEEEAVKFQAALFKLSKQIRAIPSLPLNVTDIIGLDPACRNTQVFASIAHVANKFHPTFSPLRVMCVVEGSKWPDKEDLEAIDTLKMLMLLKMNESLNSIDSLTSFVRQGGLTIFQESLQFDLTLMNASELARLRHTHDSSLTHQQFKDYVVLPHVTRTLAGVQSQHSMYGTTARLFKRWIGIHLLSTFLPEPCGDLIASALFINPKPYQVPRCPHAGFQRCLDLIVHFDWVNEPLILNFNEEITDDKLAELKEEFKTRRQQFPCMTIITPTDHNSVITRRVMPFMLKLVREVASNCIHGVDESLASMVNIDSAVQMKLFKMDDSKMDVLIELKEEKSRRRLVNLEQEGSTVEVYTDPAQNYIKHIQEAYGDKVVLMYDSNSIKYIGLIWKPGADNPVPIKRLCEGENRGAEALCDVDNELCIKLNFNSMLQDLNIVGKGIVANITINSAPGYS